MPIIGYDFGELATGDMMTGIFIEHHRSWFHWAAMVFVCSVILWWPSSSSSASSYPDSQQVAVLLDVQKHLFDDHFAAADSLCDELIDSYPNDPAGYLFRGITLITEMFAREENSREQSFKAVLDSAEFIAKAGIADSDSTRSAWMYLYLGHAEAYRSMWEAHFGSKVASVKLGMAAKKLYAAGLIQDSTVYDLHFGLGLYHYWKSAKAGFLRWLGIVANDKEKGIYQLRMAADSSLISKESARNALVWVWLDCGELDSVIAGCNTILRKYPDGITPLWPLAEAYWEKRQYLASLETYRKLREVFAEDPGNHYNLIEIDYQIHLCLKKLGFHEQVVEAVRQAFSYQDSISENTRDRQRRKLATLARAGRQ